MLDVILLQIKEIVQIIFLISFTYAYILWGKHNIRQLFIEVKLRMRKFAALPWCWKLKTSKYRESLRQGILCREQKKKIEIH
jgi:hypothetical protein